MNDARNPAHVVVLGNEKGGTGKSTIAMHMAVAFANAGGRVGVIDLDVRQKSVSRYIENRRATAERDGLALPAPTVYELAAETVEALAEAAARAIREQDLLIVDTPGAATELSRAGHVFADTLVTPLNDSFIDLDVLGRVEPETYKVLRPSHYAELVWETRKERARVGRSPLRWFVLRNRLSHVDARNKRAMEEAIAALAQRVGFVPVAGLGERVIYRELFLNGLTLLDIRTPGVGIDLSVSHVAARQELRALFNAVGFTDIIPGA
ncbi:ATPase [uncultured Alphaproteobacteria bacterium]|uniref:ATPase n=1 Tax=uncultured Alphaproteobacteria bacterium TaxID=91750 RepID=A0A212KMW4_9PROT|nr:ATPase [uncultured Alphaproteobacteria bacterium]